MMTAKERLLNTLKGKETDRMPWSPFLAYWWEHQSEERMKKGQLKFMESVGADPLLRGFAKPWKVQFNNIDIERKEGIGESIEIWKTPVGELKFRSELSGLGNSWFLTGHPVKNVGDLKTLSWIYDHASIEYDEEADRMYHEIGDRGLLLPLVGSETKTCFQSLVERYVGTVNLVYMLEDEPEEVEACLASMRRISDKTADFAAASDAEAFIFWEDSSTTNISPGMFEKYTAPEVNAWGKTLHEAGKLLVHHACGQIKTLVPLMAKTEADVIESISPPTTGNIDIPEAFSLLPNDMALIGGIEPVFFQNCTKEELETRVEFLFKACKDRRYVLANSDSCPPGVAEWKFKYVSDFVKKISLK